MTSIQQELRRAADLFRAFLDFVLAWVAYAWRWLHGVLADAGLPQGARTVVLLGVVALLVAMVLSLTRGLLRLLLVAAGALLVARAVGVV